MGGLVDDPAGGVYHTMGAQPAPSQQGGGQGSQGGLNTQVNQAQAGQTTVHSHLDSFFVQSGWTREDVLVVAALIQLIAWLLLLYMEANRR